LLLVGEDGALHYLVCTLQRFLLLDRFLLGWLHLDVLFVLSALVDFKNSDCFLDAGLQIFLASQLLLGILVKL
jgi:hypothetical protein